MSPLVVLLLVALLGCVVLMFLQRRTVRRYRQLAEEQRQAKQQIIAEQQRNRQLKQEMTSNIAHELKTPVSSIRGYLEILLGDKPVDDEKRKTFLERSYQQTLRLSDLINDVSLINKLEESSDLFPKERINVTSVVREAAMELEDMAAKHNIRFTSNLPESFNVTGNHSLLYAIFRNLIENAIVYAGDGCEVFLECYRTDSSYYFLHFYDTGTGVSNEFLPKIFDRFQRIDQGRSRKNGGTGLGLSIVKHAVGFHGGDIYAKNRDQGGLEFYFSLKK